MKIEKIDVSRMQPFPDGSIWDCINNANKINELVDAFNHLTDSHEEKWTSGGSGNGTILPTPPSWEELLKYECEIRQTSYVTMKHLVDEILSSEKLKMVEKAQKVLTTSENDVLNFSDETTLRDSYLGGIREVINHLRQELKK